eukprot:SAG31_NODE_1249_length_9118_cov_23.165318_10_plen_283_part_00
MTDLRRPDVELQRREAALEQRKLRQSQIVENRSLLQAQRLSHLIAQRDRHAIRRAKHHEEKLARRHAKHCRQALLLLTLTVAVSRLSGPLLAERAKKAQLRKEMHAVAQIQAQYRAYKLVNGQSTAQLRRRQAAQKIQRAWKIKKMHIFLRNRKVASATLRAYLLGNMKPSIVQLLKRYRFAAVTIQRRWRRRLECHTAQLCVIGRWWDRLRSDTVESRASLVDRIEQLEKKLAKHAQIRPGKQGAAAEQERAAHHAARAADEKLLSVRSGLQTSCSLTAAH